MSSLTTGHFQFFLYVALFVVTEAGNEPLDLGGIPLFLRFDTGVESGEKLGEGCVRFSGVEDDRIGASRNVPTEERWVRGVPELRGVEIIGEREVGREGKCF